MTTRQEWKRKCEARIARTGCFHLEMKQNRNASSDHAAAFEDYFLPILRVAGTCGVFGARAAELVGAESGWTRGEGGAYWKTFGDDYSGARECWPSGRISLEVSIVVPLRLDTVTTPTVQNVIRRCYDPDTVSNPTAIITEDAFRFARSRDRDSNVLYLSFRSWPTNLYVSVLGKPSVVRVWFQFAIENAKCDSW
jgi:hypothetical protein